MHFSAANPVRLVAFIGAAAVLGGGMLVLKTSQGGGSAADAQPKLLHTSVGPRAKPRQPATKPARPKPSRSPVAANGLPRSVAVALVKYPVVVISVVAPRGRVDELAVREARAAATAAGAGFVRINAFRQAEVAPLEAKVDVQGNPALIVMRRPTVVSFQVAGFVDRETIAQAVADARL